MRAGPPHGAETPQPARVAGAQLPAEMAPFVRELAARDGDSPGALPAPDLVRRESVAAGRRLRVHQPQVTRDAGDGPRLGAKARELWMMLVAARAPAQHRLRQQSLAPQRAEPAGVEIARV